MRYFVPFLLFFLFLTDVAAQSNGWEISASFAPRWSKKVPAAASYLEIDPQDRPLSQRSSALDTFRVNGVDRFFIPVGNFSLIPAESNTWFGATLQGHRRLASGFDFSVGFFWGQAKYTGLAKGSLTEQSVVNRIGNVLYTAYETTDHTMGGMVQANYHLFQKKKIHPHFGMGITYAHRSIARIFQERIYAGATTEVEGLPEEDTTPAKTNRSSFNFIATAGLLYSFSPSWSAGLAIHSRYTIGQGIIGLQIRRSI